VGKIINEHYEGLKFVNQSHSIDEVKPKASMMTGRAGEGVAVSRTRQRATTLHCVKGRQQSPWRYSWRGAATQSLISGGGAVLHSVAMSRKAVFAVVSHLSRCGSSLLCVRVNITNETHLFLVITIAADSKLWQRRLWTMVAAVTAVVDSNCGWWLRTAAADNDDGSLRMKTMAAGSGGGGG